MRRSARIVVVLGLLAAAVLEAAEPRLPDPATGSINGRSALLFWPVLPTNDPGRPKLLPAEGCRIHLVPFDDPAVEHRYACGTWFQPPPARYNAWMETADRISAPWTVIYSGVPSKGGLAAVTPLHAAGRVAIPAERSLPDGEELRILSLDGHRTMKSGRIFERRVPREEARTPVLMPAGQIVIGRFDKKSGDAIALSRPATLAAGAVLRVWPEPPAGGKSDLLVVLAKPPRVAASDETRLLLSDGERRRRADVALDVNRVLGIWYGVDAGSATVSLRAETMAWPEREVRLTPGRVSTIRARAEPPPKLRVQVTAPGGAVLPDDLRVTVRRFDDERPLASASIAAGAAHEFANLPAALHQVTLDVGEWTFVRDVDLSSGRDGEALFALEPIALTGRIFLGDDPVAAELRFHNRAKWVSVRTDDAGAYRATLWHAGDYTIRIAVAGRAPFTQHFTPIDESGERDFHLPLTNYTLRVVDAATGAPLAGAKANVGNVWLDESQQEQSLLDTLLTDDAGSATLPPLRAGRLLVTVSVKGYADEQLERAVVQGDEEPHALTMSLRRQRASHRLRLRSSHGEPLSGAEIWAFSALDLTAPVWQATTGSDGLVDVIDEMNDALFLIRHPSAASVVRRWSGGEDNLVEWQLEAPAPALVAAITRPGDVPARSAHVALWLDGVRLSGVPLAFATWSSPAADRNGLWTARNLPHRAARLLAIPSGSPSRIEGHAYDGMATTVAFPWAAPAPVITVE